MFEEHQYSIDSIVFDVMETFKLNSIDTANQHQGEQDEECQDFGDRVSLLLLKPCGRSDWTFWRILVGLSFGGMGHGPLRPLQ